MVVAGMRRGQQMLVAILDPAHRVVEFEGQRGEDDLLRIEPRLRAEPAADIGRDDAQLVERRRPRISPIATRTVCGVWVEA